MLQIIDQGVLSRSARGGAYMPSITHLSDGSLIACQHVGVGLATPDNHIEVLRTADGGKTWRNQGPIHGPEPTAPGRTAARTSARCPMDVWL